MPALPAVEGLHPKALPQAFVPPGAAAVLAAALVGAEHAAMVHRSAGVEGLKGVERQGKGEEPHVQEYAAEGATYGPRA